jgi:hypothetical protein
MNESRAIVRAAGREREGGRRRDPRQREARQSGRDVAEDRDAAAGQVEQGRAGDRQRDDHERLAAEAAEGQQERDRGEPDQQRGPVDARARGPQLADDRVQAGARRQLHAEQRAELAGRDDERRRRGEAAEHRLRQEVDDEPEAERAHRELNDADHHREGGRGDDHGLPAEQRHAAERGGDEQRVHRHRPDRELGRAAEHRVDERRGDRGVEADDRRQAGEHRVGHRLRDEHHRRRQARRQVAGQVGPAVARQPREDRDESSQSVHRRGHCRNRARVSSAQLGRRASPSPACRIVLQRPRVATAPVP